MQIKSADNRILQEELQNKVKKRHYLFLLLIKMVVTLTLSACQWRMSRINGTVIFYVFQCLENKELQEAICNLEQQLAVLKVEKSYPSSEQQGVSDEYIDDLKKKIQLQVIYILQPRINWLRICLLDWFLFKFLRYMASFGSGDYEELRPNFIFLIYFHEDGLLQGRGLLEHITV